MGLAGILRTGVWDGTATPYRSYASAEQGPEKKSRRARCGLLTAAVAAGTVNWDKATKLDRQGAVAWFHFSFQR